jgi:hypothetical protein
MTNGYGGVTLQQQQGGRFAYDVAAADHNGMPPGDIDTRPFEDGDNPGWRARRQTGLADLQLSDVQGMKTVYVFFRSNSPRYRSGVQVVRKGQLDKNAVNAFVSVKLIKKPKQIIHLGVSGQTVYR